MAERAFYVLAYDITDDRRRAKIAKLMEAQGERVQGSVFEAYLTTAELDKLLAKVGKALAPKEDGLRVYQLCSECRSKVRTVGVSQVTPPPGVKIV